MLKISTLAIALLVLSAVSVSAQDFDKGFAAYERGDYATALREWTSVPCCDPRVAYYQALMHYYGQGTQQDYKMAALKAQIAAGLGNAAAQGFLGVLYASGHGVIQDVLYAHMWLNIAASNGIENAVVSILPR
jgi:TPR repeat protein